VPAIDAGTFPPAEYDDLELEGEFAEEMAAGMMRGGAPLSGQTALEVFSKKLIHKDFYNSFTDDCDPDVEQQ